MMTRITFLYIAINLLCFNLISSGSKIIAIVISAACILGILTIGISHGAIDNLLYKTETKKRAGLSFYLRYIAIIIAVVVIWAFAPNIAFILFLIASAYHFGQSQFVHYFQRNNKLAPYLYFSWGFLILMLSFWLNYAEIQTLVNDYLENVFVLNQLAKYGGIFSLCFGLITLACLIYAVKCKAIKLSILFYELYIIGLIALSFYVLPLLVGFALYFIILHSLKVMREEYEFCKNSYSSRITLRL